MAQTNVTFRMDEDLKKQAEALFNELGMNLTTAYTIFTKAALRHRGLPFDVSIDPFYSESNMKYLNSVISDIESGKAKLTEHDLIED